ncbi:MAG: type II toxin-antitoxin system VapC family toxin [Thermoanaerobaculia bacterium]
MILLDTHALVWLVEGSPRLGAKAKARCERASTDGNLAASAVTFWELATLSKRGRVTFGKSMETWRDDLLAAGLVELPVTGDIAIVAGQIGGFDGDPADRLIVASAIRTGATLVTADARILDWSGVLKRADAGR